MCVDDVLISISRGMSQPWGHNGAPPVLRPVALACGVGNPEAQHLQDTRRDAYMTLCHICMIHYESTSLILFPKP